MLAKLDQLAERLDEIGHLLMQEGATNDMDNYRKLNREHAELDPVVTLYKNYQQAQSDLDEAQEMLNDPDMKAFAQDEIEAAKEKMQTLESDLQKMLLPKDPNENVIFCWRSSGTGEMKQPCLPVICCACITASLNVTAGK
jgi:peptide chain release factor 1